MPNDPSEETSVAQQLPQRLQPYNPTTGRNGGYSATVATVAKPVVAALPKRQPTPAEAEAMRAHYARTHSKTGVCMRFYGYKDGDTWGWVEMALKGRI